MAVIYRPDHERQLVPSDKWGKYNCTAVSVAIAADRATIGGVMVNGKDIRAASNEPIPNPGSPGLNLAQATNALYRLTRVVLLVRRTTWTTCVDNLRKGMGIVLSGDYDAMGNYSCQPSFRDLHAVYVNNLNTAPVTINGTTYGAGKAGLTYDPLCPAYKWVPLTILRTYAARYAAVLNHVGAIYATTRITPLVEAN